jgi:hypothetical protein
MTYVVEMGPHAMIYIPSFINWFRLSQVNREGFTDRQHGYCIRLRLFFFQNKDSRLNTTNN